jgi:hypothetical protein
MGSEGRTVIGAARGLVLALGAVTFLVAAKAHGRQLRVERELAGYWHVTFGAQNPAFVETLWRRERLIYWSLAVLVALGTIGFRLLAPRFAWTLPVEGGRAGSSLAGVVFLHVLVPMIVAFVVTGLLSVARFAAAPPSDAARAHPQNWLSHAVWASAGWWLLTVALGAALCVLAWRKPG